MNGSISEQWVRRIVFAGIVLQMLFLIASFPHAPFNIDEAWLGEQAYHEAHDGVIHQKLLSGVFGGEEQIVVRHKLFIFAGDLAIRAFGFSLTVLRTISFAAGLVLIALVSFFPRRKGSSYTPHYPLAAFILLCCPLVFTYAQVYRPEMMLAVLGFASFLFVLRVIEEERAYAAVVFAGIAAGLALLTHLNGVMFIAAGFGTLLLFRKWRESAVFLAVPMAVGAIYLYDILGNYGLFVAQFFNDFTVEGSDYQGFPFFMKLLHEHERYFRTPEIIGISALFILSLTVAFRKTMTEYRALFTYTLLLVVSLSFVAKGIPAKCAIPVFPFFALGIANSVSMIMQGKVKPRRPVLVLFAVLGLVYAGYGMFSAGKSAFTGHRDIATENALVAAGMTAGTKVLAPGRFIYNEIDRFEVHDLYAAHYIITHEKRRKFTLSSLCEYALAHDFDYIILDGEYRKEARIEPEKILPAVWGYEAVTGYTDGTLLIRRAGNIR